MRDYSILKMELQVCFVILFLIFIPRTLCVQPCSVANSIDISDGNHLPNGDIYYNGTRYQKKDYIHDNDTKTTRGCICQIHKCMKKCCPIGYGYGVNQKKCLNNTEVFDPPVWNKHVLLKNVNASDKFHFLTEVLKCGNSSSRVRITKITENFHLRVDGKLYIELPNSIPPWTVRTPDQYCLDTFIFQDEAGVKTSKLDALVCFDQEEGEQHYLLSSTCMLISCVFILATVAVYAWLPELKNLHGRVLVAYLLCLFVGFAFLASMQIMLLVDNITASMCLAFTFIIYQFLLSAFFWLNVMCFDIWWTFSGKRGLSLEKLSTRGRFNAYAAYAFGIPTALTILLIALEFSGLPPHPLLPMIKYQGCFIFGNSKLLYLYGPIVILCIANMVFFVLTALRIASINKQTSVLKSKESATHDAHRRDKQRLLLYVKLFLVMGISWLLEVISAIYPDAKEFWKYTDAYNVLIGLTIFIIFVCKRKTFRLIKKRYKQLQGESMSGSGTQTTISRTVSSRDDIRLSSLKSNVNK